MNRKIKDFSILQSIFIKHILLIYNKETGNYIDFEPHITQLLSINISCELIIVLIFSEKSYANF